VVRCSDDSTTRFDPVNTGAEIEQTVGVGKCIKHLLPRGFLPHEDQPAMIFPKEVHITVNQ